MEPSVKSETRFALLIVFNYSWLLESLMDLAWYSPDSAVGRAFFQKLGLHPFRSRNFALLNTPLTVSVLLEKKTVRQLPLVYRRNPSSASVAHIKALQPISSYHTVAESSLCRDCTSPFLAARVSAVILVYKL